MPFPNSLPGSRRSIPTSSARSHGGDQRCANSILFGRRNRGNESTSGFSKTNPTGENRMISIVRKLAGNCSHTTASHGLGADIGLGRGARSPSPLQAPLQGRVVARARRGHGPRRPNYLPEKIIFSPLASFCKIRRYFVLMSAAITDACVKVAAGEAVALRRGGLVDRCEPGGPIPIGQRAWGARAPIRVIRASALPMPSAAGDGWRRPRWALLRAADRGLP